MILIAVCVQDLVCISVDPTLALLQQDNSDGDDQENTNRPVQPHQGVQLIRNGSLKFPRHGNNFGRQDTKKAEKCH